MFTLLHHPFCPHSRFIRLALGEVGRDVRLVEERVWERREAFLVLNPAGTTPVLKSYEHYFFRLSDEKCKAFLRKWLATPGRQSQVVNKAKEWLDGEGDKALDGSVGHPRVRVDQQVVAGGRRAHAGVQPRAEAPVLLLDHAHLREALAHELERPVGRAVVDEHGLDPPEALETLLDPGQPVVGDGDGG